MDHTRTAPNCEMGFIPVAGTDDSRTRDSQNWRSGLRGLTEQGRHRARYHGVLDRDVKSPAEEAV